MNYYRVKKLLIILMTACVSTSYCKNAKNVTWISTTTDSLFVEKTNVNIFAGKDVIADITVLLDKPQQTIDGFGGCFNELGWTTLSALSNADRQAILKDLFGENGMNFNFCRLPIGANDFARDWYSFNETDGDFAMKRFSFDNDKETLIPFIKAAQAINPKLRLWASPWSPPAWMKYNKHYACRPNPDVNDLTGDPSRNLEGTNMFIQEPEYFKAYALYFRKFIEAYRSEGINIEMIAPQNEFNSCQIFPSCTWTAAGLSAFIGDYLGPQMKELGVRVMFGTMERGNQSLVDTVMRNKSGGYISEIGFQWAGKNAVEAIHKTYPGMKLMQSESECGDGKNTWKYCFYIWNLMKHYFRHGVSSYMYWNISLDITPGNSRWKWPQNSLISVNQEAKTYRYNPEYYLMKHFSKYVKPGAVFLALDGEFKNALAFRNADGSIVMVFANEDESNEAKTLNIRIGGKVVTVNRIPPKSINTLILKPAIEASAQQVITANPMNLNYRFYPPEKQDKGREAADPVCEYFKGKYYLFASKSGGYWSSTDLANWNYIPCKTITTIEDYAPAILIYNNAIYYAGSGKAPKIFRNENPDVDNWVEIDVKFNTQIEESLNDVAFYADDDGKTYMYWGCSDKDPIRGIRIEPENGFSAVGEPVTLIEHHFEKYGWETPGDKNQNNKKGYNEGPCMIKYNGKYYLQYAAPGTQWRNYGDGVYTSDNPLGPYVYDETSPFSFKPGGFIGGAGHGHTFKDKYGNYWHVASMTIAVKHMFERRLGLFPVYFSTTGHIHAHTVLTDYPFEIPQKKVDFSISNFSKNWNLLSFRKQVAASSFLAGCEPEKAVDEMIETFWSSRTGNAGEWLRIDLGQPSLVSALQINFADHEFKIRGFLTYFNYQYIVEASNDGKTWTKLIDKTENVEDKPHDFMVLKKPVTVRYLKITNTREVPGKFSLTGFRIFGKGNGKAPKAVAKLNVLREEDTRRYKFSWDAAKDATGYIIRWGTDKNELKNSTMVMGDTQLEAGYFNRDSKYCFSIDSFNENGMIINKKVYETDIIH